MNNLQSHIRLQPVPTAYHPDISALDSEQLLTELSSRYDVVEKTLALGHTGAFLLGVRDTNRLVDGIDPATFAHDERLPYWADLWVSAVGLAEWCLERGEISGKEILELGCGLGLAGIAAGIAGAHVMLTDYEEDALAFARYNAMRNLPPGVLTERVRFRQLDWRSPGELAKVDLVIAADVTYERRNFLPLLRLVSRVLRPGGMAVFADPDRAVGREFLSIAAAQHHAVTTHTRSVAMNGLLSTIVVAEIRPPQDARP